MMKTYIFLYQEVSFFEVDLAAYFMKTKGEVKIVTDEDKVINTNEGVKILADITLPDLQPETGDVFVVCGGNIDNIGNMEGLYEVIRNFGKKGAVVGGICAGRNIVADALGIKAFGDKTETVDTKIVLSPGNEYVDFALEVGKAADIYEDEADYQETIDYFKHFQYHV